MYIFPALGLGIVASQATTVTDHMLYVAARRLADCVSDEDLAQGKVGTSPVSRVHLPTTVVNRCFRVFLRSARFRDALPWR
jgi:malic enzyme